MSESTRSHKIAVIGAGGVGATIAYACLIRGVVTDVALYDVDKSKVEAETLDLAHGLQFVPAASVKGSDDIGVCAGAAVVVITAGAKQKPGQTRIDLAVHNVEICRKIVPEILRVAPQAILLLVTNPVDVLTYVTLKLSGLPRNRVLGSGTVLDGSRFRYLIAKRLRVAVQSVHGYIAGEHGDSEVPLWSSAMVAGIPLHEWAVMHHGKLSVLDRTEIFQNVKTAAYQIVQGKGATNYAIGLATATILEALLNDENRVLAVSSLLENYRMINGAPGSGISDVCLSVPCIVNRNGVEPPLPIPMNANEESGLRNSAEVIRAAITTLGF
jgi:L-lactate dehydrogenase